MASWGTVLTTAVLTAVATFVGMAPLDRPNSLRRLFTGAAGAACGPLLWALLVGVGTGGVAARQWGQAAFPVSRADAGVAVCTLATVTVILGLGPDGRLAARRMLAIPVAAAVAAFFIALYLA